MKKINNIKFLIFFIFLFFTATQQIEAYKKTNIVDGGVGESVEVLSYTAPENNEVMAGDNINLSFEILYKPLSIAETKTKFYNSVQLYFIGRVDGVADAPFNVLVDYGTDRLNNLNKVKTISTHDFQVASDNSKATNYSWNLADAAGKKILATGSFTFKTNTKMKGWYNTMKANTSTETIFTVSGPYTSQALCKKYIDDVLQGKDSFTKATNFQYSVYLDCNQYDTRPITPNNIVLINPGSNAGTAVSTTYTFLAPIGDSLTIDTNDIGAYFNLIFKLAIGLCAALAVIMIIIGGVQYMGDESVFGKTEAKDRIIKAILGLLIAVGSWALLNTINPALTGVGGINVSKVNVRVAAIEYISSDSFTQITGKKTLTPTQYDELGRKVAKEVGIPFCAIKVILERESKGNPGAIGFDENVRKSDIPSRVAFVNSGKKYSGESFTPSSSLITKDGFINQSKSNVKKTPGLGLDWRFSKGIGLTQITLFPKNGSYFDSGYKTSPPGLDTKDDYPTLNGYTPMDLLDPEKNLKSGALVWKQSWTKCKSDIYGAWVGYGGGPGKCTTSNSFLKGEATTRTEYYNSCSDADKKV